MIDKIFNFLFPPVCGICLKKTENWICKECLKKLNINLNIIKNSVNDIKYNLYFISYYKDNIKKLLIDYKFNRKSYIYKTFSNIIINNNKLCKILKSYDIMIPVPMNKKRQFIRGYNQTELITKELSKKLKIENCSILEKVKENKMQSKLSFIDRKNNVKNVFKVKNKFENIINQKNIIIFDDIYTTGFTTLECIKEIKKFNPKKIDIFVISKGKIEG